MSRILLGTICALVYGALSAASMIPLSFADKTAALTGAFLNRFAIGLVIGSAHLPVPSWAQGLIFGVLLSLPPMPLLPKPLCQSLSLALSAEP
jgi:hypothetical protein